MMKPDGRGGWKIHDPNKDCPNCVHLEIERKTCGIALTGGTHEYQVYTCKVKSPAFNYDGFVNFPCKLRKGRKK